MFATDVNFLAVLVAGVAYFMLGGLWYSPILFGKTWLKAIGKTEEDIKNEGGAGAAYAISFVGSLLAAYFLATFISSTTLFSGLQTSFCIWLGFVATTNAPPYFYENKPKSLYLIYAGYTVVGFLIMGGILAVWI